MGIKVAKFGGSSVADGIQLKKLKEKLAEEGFPNAPIEDVLSYASFPEVTLNFLRHSNIGMHFHDM